MTNRPTTYFAGAAAVFGLLFLLLAPAQGSISLSVATQAFTERLHQRYDAAETAELNLLDCFARAVATVPANETVSIETTESYVQQRMTEIIYPRSKVVERSASYRVDVDVEKNRGTVIAETACDRFDIKVVDNR